MTFADAVERIGVGDSSRSRVPTDDLEGFAADLELNSQGGTFGTFAGVPRQAVLAALGRDGRIELAFTLEGRLDDPKLSLNELFAARFAVGLAEKLGVSLGGVVEGVGSVIKGLFGR